MPTLAESFQTNSSVGSVGPLDGKKKIISKVAESL